MSKLFLIGLFILLYIVLFFAAGVAIYIGVADHSLLMLVLGLAFATRIGWNLRDEAPRYIIKPWKDYKSEKEKT